MNTVLCLLFGIVAGELSVSGLGSVSVKPDTAFLTFGVVTKGTTVQEAFSNNNIKMTNLCIEMHAMGVEEQKIKTSNFNLSPYYEDKNPNNIAGYIVSNDISVSLSDLSKTGDAIAKAIDAGANQIRGLSFGVKDESKHLSHARTLAVADAKEKAQLYADSLGIKLGHPKNISEHHRHPSSSRMMQASYDAASISGGEEAITVNVNIIFETE